MAKGVDAEAAWGALEQGGAVVGVLGGGVDTVYPRENAALYERVKARGCLLSEYPPGTAPNGRHFPARNRIISALSDGVVVVRAAEKSGSLITARWAAEQGRDVYAVPGDPNDPLSRGCNALLRDGAFAAASGWDVLERYQFRYPGTVARAICPPEQAAGSRQQAAGNAVAAEEAKTSPACRGGGPASRPVEGCRQPEAPAVRLDLSSLNSVQRQIVEALRGGPLQLDTLIDRLGLPAGQVLPQLTLLQIKKIITQKPGKQYELSGGL
jgi:DNA processing protein